MKFKNHISSIKLYKKKLKKLKEKKKSNVLKTHENNDNKYKKNNNKISTKYNIQINKLKLNTHECHKQYCIKLYNIYLKDKKILDKKINKLRFPPHMGFKVGSYIQKNDIKIKTLFEKFKNSANFKNLKECSLKNCNQYILKIGNLKIKLNKKLCELSKKHKINNIFTKKYCDNMKSHIKQLKNLKKNIKNL